MGTSVVNVELTLPVTSHADRSLLPLIEELCGDARAWAAGWQVESDTDPGAAWVGVRHVDSTQPDQGWKLHVSATVASAEIVVRRAAPVLLAENASFKVAASIRALRALNSEAEGRSLSQIGKFITVYPNNDAQAVRLAAALDAATRDLPGPAIPSDRPLKRGSLVHYRYGGFANRLMQLPTGEMVPALQTPDGELVPDRRLPVYQCPAWAVDPFDAAGVAGEVSSLSPLIADRYLLVTTLHASPRGAVYLAVDIVEPRSCVVKQARRAATGSVDGRDATHRLRHEAEVLTRLASDPRFPAVYNLIERDGDLFLAMEDVEGTTLDQWLATLVIEGRFLPGEQVVRGGREVAAMLDAIHAAGFVYGDVKTSNVVVLTDGTHRLIDFELARDREASGGHFGGGTRGYMSPRREAGSGSAVADDIYGLGALLYGLATNAEPSVAPDATSLLDRPPELLNPAVSPALAAVIARCLAHDPEDRFVDMAAVGDALARVLDAPRVAPVPFGGEPGATTEETAIESARELARRLGDTLCATAQPAPDRVGVRWSSGRESGDGGRFRDLNAGSAGAVLALAEIVDVLNRPRHREVLAAGARYLIVATRAGGLPVGGLYVGEAGIGAALLRAGQILGDRDLVAAAADRGALVASLPHGSPDLFNGLAGRLRFHLLLWDATSDPLWLQHARAAGDAILSAAEEAGPGELRWTIPPGYDAMSGKAYLGYAHGAAGIADVLLDLAEATDDRRFLMAARQAAHWLLRLAVPVLGDGSGFNWPSVEDAKPAAPFWCHGSTGIGRFLLHAAALDLIPDAADAAARAAAAVARAARWAGPTQCHGLAGNIEYLLDVYQATGDGAYLTEVRSLGRLLDAFVIERNEGLMYPSDSPTVFGPDYMVGYAGVAPCLLRLADPESRPHLLSRAGFRHRAAVTA